MRWNRPAQALFAALVGLTIHNCSGDGDGGGPAPVATTLALVSGNDQIGTVGTALVNPIIVKVTDQDGTAMANVSVVFAVTAGGGSLGAATVATNSQGQASTIWTLGTTAGANAATATVTGLTGSPVAFTATATAGSGTQVVITSGNTQAGEVLSAVAQAPTVTIHDAYGNPVPGATVWWAVLAGGGSVSAGTSQTNAQGEASIAWTLGPVVGTGLQSLRTSINSGAFGTFTASGVLSAGTLAINGGDNQSAAAGTAVATTPSVLVKTPGGSGVPVQGVTVTWAVTAGGGWTSAATSVTNAAGIASIGWTVGTTLGANTQGLSATATGLTGSPATFVASATPPPTQMFAVSGDVQTGLAGLPMPEPMVVVVLDASDAPVEGVAVKWQVAWGGGSLPDSASLTDASGQASMLLTAGTTAGPHLQAVSAWVPEFDEVRGILFTASTVGGPPATLQEYTGNGQTGVVGTTLLFSLGVIVKDQYGNPSASSVIVNWAAAPGSGSTFAASSVTGASGSDGITWMGWRLGTVAGTDNQFATATVPGLPGSPVNFTASATAGPAAALAVVSGDNQSAMAGSPLPAPLVVLVQDQYGNPVSGVVVDWVAATGGGSVSAPTSTTDEAGMASIGRTLGGFAGPQTTTAAVPGATPVTVTFNSTSTAGIRN